MSLMSPSLIGVFFTTSATSETESKRNMWNVQNTPDKTLRNQRRKWTQRGSSREDAKPYAPRKWGKFMCWTQILPFPPMFVEGKKHISPIFLDSFLRSPPCKNMRGEQGSTAWLSGRLSLFFSSPLISFWRFSHLSLPGAEKGHPYLPREISLIDVNVSYKWLASTLFPKIPPCLHLLKDNKLAIILTPKRNILGQQILLPFICLHVGSSFFKLKKKSHCGDHSVSSVLLWVSSSYLPSIKASCGDLKSSLWASPGSPGVNSQRFHCKGHRVHPWSVNYDAACCTA